MKTEHAIQFKRITALILFTISLLFWGCQSPLLSEDPAVRRMAVDNLQTQEELAAIVMDAKSRDPFLIFGTTTKANLPLDLRKYALGKIDKPELLVAIASASFKEGWRTGDGDYFWNVLSLAPPHPEIREIAIQKLHTVEGLTFLIAHSDLAVRKPKSNPRENEKQRNEENKGTYDTSTADIICDQLFYARLKGSYEVLDNLKGQGLEILNNILSNKSLLIECHCQGGIELEKCLQVLPEKIPPELCDKLNARLAHNLQTEEYDVVVQLLNRYPEDQLNTNIISDAIVASIGKTQSSALFSFIEGLPRELVSQEAREALCKHIASEVKTREGLVKFRDQLKILLPQESELQTSLMRDVVTRVLSQSTDENSNFLFAAVSLGMADVVKENVNRLSFDAYYSLNYYYGPCAQKDGFNALEFALLHGETEIATFLFDSGAYLTNKIQTYYRFWRSVKDAEAGQKCAEWLISNGVTDALYCYNMSLACQNLALAKKLQEKYKDLKPTWSAYDYFCSLPDKASADSCLELMKYLKEQGLLLEEREKNKSALADLSRVIWNDRSDHDLSIPLQSTIEYLIAEGVDVNIPALQQTKKMATSSEQLLDELARHPEQLYYVKERLGLDENTMNELIKRIEDIPHSENYRNMTKLIIAGAPILGHDVDAELTRGRRDITRNILKDVLEKHGKLKYDTTTSLILPPLGAMARVSNVSLCKLFLEKGAKVPCIITTQTTSFNIIDGEREVFQWGDDEIHKPNEEIIRLLRVAQRKQGKQ